MKADCSTLWLISTDNLWRNSFFFKLQMSRALHISPIGLFEFFFGGGSLHSWVDDTAHEQETTENHSTTTKETPLQWHRNKFESGGGTRPTLFVVVPLHFLTIQVQLVVSVSALVMVGKVRSVSCLMFFYSRCLPCPAICKSGRTCPRAHMESAPLPSWSRMANSERTVSLFGTHKRLNNILRPRSVTFLYFDPSIVKFVPNLGLSGPASRRRVTSPSCLPCQLSRRSYGENAWQQPTVRFTDR